MQNSRNGCPVLSTWLQIADNIAMNSLPNYRGYRFPPEIISYTVWLYYRFTLSLRDIEDLLAERNVIVSYESIRRWCARFGLDYAKRLRKGRGPGGDRWFLDEVTVSIQGERQYLWCAVDQDGDLLDILLQSRKDKRAAKRFFRKLLKGQERTPIGMTTDKLRSYAAAKREMMPSVVHCQDKYANNRAEVSHEHTPKRTPDAGVCIIGSGTTVSQRSWAGTQSISDRASSFTGSKLSSLTWPRVRNGVRGDLRPMR